MFKKYVPLITLITVAVLSYLYAHPNNVISDTLSDYIVNPAATAVVNGKAGSHGYASVTTNGEQFITSRGTALPVSITGSIGVTGTVGVTGSVGIVGPIPTQSAANPVSVTTPLPTSAPAEATPIANTIVAATAVPTALSTPNAIDAAGLKNAYVYSSLNQEIWCAINGGTIEFPVPAGFYWFQNYKEQGVKVSSGISCHHHGTPPTTGSYEVGGFN